jgi:hypothetical protein
MDGHTIIDRYVAESSLASFLKDKGIYTEKEWDEEMKERRERLKKRLAMKNGL